MSSCTLAGRMRHAVEIRRSRFLVQAAPVDDPVAALAFIDEVADAGATHNCWAYRIGQQYRSSDDGEPGGTAGRPILAAIDGSGLDGVVAVVTRWFGGIRLGAGGLVRAYGGSVAECLRLAPRVQRVAMVEAEVACGFALASSVHALLEAFGAVKRGERHQVDGTVLAVQVPAGRVDALAQALRDLSRGNAGLRLVEASAAAPLR